MFTGTITIDVEVVDTDYRALQLPRAAPVAPPWDVLPSPSAPAATAAAGDSRPSTPVQRPPTPAGAVASPRPLQSSSGSGAAVATAKAADGSSPVPSLGAAAAAGSPAAEGATTAAAAGALGPQDGDRGAVVEQGRQGIAGSTASGSLAYLGPAFAPPSVLGALDIVVRGAELTR